MRVVIIGDFDVTPCGGKHCTRSGQVGLVRITGVERYKGKARVTFSAGRRARGELWRETAALHEHGRAFTCGPLDVSSAVEKLRRELVETRDAPGHVRSRLAVLVARATASPFDCGAFLKRAAAKAGGRGGGRPERAAGRLPATTDWTALVAELAPVAVVGPVDIPEPSR